MKNGQKRRRRILFFSIILVFCILATVVFSVARKISLEMSSSAIHNLSESLDLIQSMTEAILDKEAEFQKMIAREIANVDDPYEFISAYEENQTIVKLSLLYSGETKGISSTGEVFSDEKLDFTSGKEVGGIPVSQSYLNDMGTWAYTMKCPVRKDGREIATLYAEYIYESFEGILPYEFYNGSAVLYIMDSNNERLVLKPTGMGERDAGHVNLEDFYRANKILESSIQTEVANSIKQGKNTMFYHNIQDKNSLIYMWAINDGAVYLIGYVPIEAIQQEGRSVNQSILIIVIIMLAAFFFCAILYFLFQKQQSRLQMEREAEKEAHNKQLAEALQAAQIASNSKTTFLSNMSHDIRTPMNAILGFTTLLAKDADHPARVREYTDKITSSGQHLLSLINDVLDVSKIESGKVVLTVGEFTLNDLVSSVDAIIRPMAEGKNQNFHVSVTDVKHEYLSGDETRLNQIIINLLSNAVKYTQEGGDIWFRIIGKQQYSSQYEHIRIEVEDNGYGMTPEYLEIIFDAFTRAENSTTNKVQGTGLGMAITKNIVELMGGTIDVTSEVNKGSLFQVDLELRIPNGLEEEQFWKESGISRILAVDYDMETGHSIQTLLKGAGMEVDVAESVDEAFHLAEDAACKNAQYQVILLAWEMQDMNGAEAARKLRTVVPESVPILFLTDHFGNEIPEDTFFIENIGFLVKPFFISAFKEELLKIQAEQNGESFSAETKEDDSIAGMHFLVAEDNEINAEILSELLDMENATCEFRENGQLVLERFANAAAGEFDAILMDIQMPVMNGYEASRKIRELDREDARSIPIIAMTANAFAEDVKDALDAGMNVHISKPVDMNLLKKTVKQYVK
ncbi:MAG: response regulator [Eubacterium sp.]|nr:response regulator [Eubacterium sp.]